MEDTRKKYDELIERVFRSEEKKSESSVNRNDLEALEKEISIDIAELRRDLRSFRKDLFNGKGKAASEASDIINEENRAGNVSEATGESGKVNTKLMMHKD